MKIDGPHAVWEETQLPCRTVAKKQTIATLAISVGTMGLRLSRIRPDRLRYIERSEEEIRSSEIDAELERLKFQDALKIKLLMLGSPGSGKSSICRQIWREQGNTPTEDERRLCGVYLRSNIVNLVRELCREIHKLNLEARLKAEESSYAASFLDFDLTPKEAYELLLDIFEEPDCSGITDDFVEKATIRVKRNRKPVINNVANGPNTISLHGDISQLEIKICRQVSWDQNSVSFLFSTLVLTRSMLFPFVVMPTLVTDNGGSKSS